MTGDDEKIKVFRVLVYEGKRKDIEAALGKSWVRPLGVSKNYSIAELLCTELPEGTLIGVPLAKDPPKSKIAQQLDEDLPRLLPWQKGRER